MVTKASFWEVPRFPSFHPGGCDRDPVNPTCSVWQISSDIAKALALENLTRSMNRIFTLKTIFCRIKSFLVVSRACNAQTWILHQLLQQKLKLIRSKRYIRIQISDGFELQELDSFESGIERVNFRSKIAVLPLRQTDQFNPGIAGSVAIDNFCGVVR